MVENIFFLIVEFIPMIFSDSWGYLHSKHLEIL